MPARSDQGRVRYVDFGLLAGAVGLFALFECSNSRVIAFKHLALGSVVFGFCTGFVLQFGL